MQINEDQKLIERWEVNFERAPRLGEHRCRIHFHHPVIIASSGTGRSVEEARIDALVRMAAGYINISDEESDWAVSDAALEHMYKMVTSERRRRRQAVRVDI